VIKDSKFIKNNLLEDVANIPEFKEYDFRNKFYNLNFIFIVKSKEVVKYAW